MVIALHCLGAMTKGSVYVFIQTRCLLMCEPTSPEPQNQRKYVYVYTDTLCSDVGTHQPRTSDSKGSSWYSAPIDNNVTRRSSLPKAVFDTTHLSYIQGDFCVKNK